MTYGKTGTRRFLIITTGAEDARVGTGGYGVGGTNILTLATALASSLLSPLLNSVTWSPTTWTNWLPSLANAPLCIPLRALPNSNMGSSAGRSYVYFAHSTAPKRTDQFDFDFNSTPNRKCFSSIAQCLLWLNTSTVFCSCPLLCKRIFDRFRRF